LGYRVKIYIEGKKRLGFEPTGYWLKSLSQTQDKHTQESIIYFLWKYTFVKVKTELARTKTKLARKTCFKVKVG